MEQNQCACMKPEDVMSDFLLCEKHLTCIYNTSLLEAATPEVRRSLSELLNDTHSQQEALFDEMSRRGWYNVTKADGVQVDNAKQKYGTTVCQ